MTDKLSREEVLHVAHLARVGLSEEDIEKYQLQLKKLMDEIDKIKDVETESSNILITPVDYDANLREDASKDTINNGDAMKNVPRKRGNFVEVPVMLNE